MRGLIPYWIVQQAAKMTTSTKPMVAVVVSILEAKKIRSSKQMCAYRPIGPDMLVAESRQAVHPTQYRICLIEVDVVQVRSKLSAATWHIIVMIHLLQLPRCYTFYTCYSCYIQGRLCPIHSSSLPEVNHRY